MNLDQFEARTELEQIMKAMLTQGVRQSENGLTLFNERKVVRRQQQVILNSNIPISNQRDDTTPSSNNATVTKQGSEYRLRATADANSHAVMTTKQRGIYLAGNVSEAGVGARPDALPTGDAYMRWGPYDYNAGNRIGPYFQLDSDGLHAVIEDNGVVIDSKPQKKWNLNPLNNLDILSGNVFQVAYGFYGYFPFMYEVSNQYDSIIPHSITPAHWYKRDGNVSLINPNLPITVEVNSGTTGQQLDLFIGGRQFSTYGDKEAKGRPEEVSRSLAGIGTTFTPLIAFKSKDSLQQIVKYIDNISLAADNRGYWRLVKGDAPTGGSAFGEIGNKYNPNETSIEVITDATTIGVNTETIGSGIFTGSNRASSINRQQISERELYQNDVYTLEIAADSTNVDMLGSIEIKTIW